MPKTTSQMRQDSSVLAPNCTTWFTLKFSCLFFLTCNQICIFRNNLNLVKYTHLNIKKFILAYYKFDVVYFIIINNSLYKMIPPKAKQSSDLRKALPHLWSKGWGGGEKEERERSRRGISQMRRKEWKYTIWLREEDEITHRRDRKGNAQNNAGSNILWTLVGKTKTTCGTAAINRGWGYYSQTGWDRRHEEETRVSPNFTMWVIPCA